MHAEIDEPEKAIAHLLKAIKIDRKSEAASFNLAVAYMAKGQHENAERFFKQALLINPVNLKAVIELAGLEMRKGAYQAGAHYYQRAIELNPNDSSVLKDFGDAHCWAVY
jgi:Tfp pilus assembly protein PilF